MSGINGPIPPEIMRNYAKIIDSLLPKGKGFMLIVYDFEPTKPGGTTYAGYVSSGTRPQCVKALKECAESLESQMN